MKQYSLALLVALAITSCDSSSPENSSQPAAASIGITATTPSTVDPISTNTQITGELMLQNNGESASDITIKVRDSVITASMLNNGEFALDLPKQDEERTVTLDITGSNVINKSMAVTIPALAEEVSIDATLAGRTDPITFNLDAGGELQNPMSPTRTRVTVPANAFQFLDGSNATGNAQVSITEIDITDLQGDSAWAPNLVGIAEGMVDVSALTTFGMSDFHFSQDGKDLQLRPGVTANISMDLISPYTMLDGEEFPSPAYEGGVMPLWHYDVTDMIWKEESQATVIADNQSISGFRMAGEVSHFSTWNIDAVTPSLLANVIVRLIDEQGAPRNDLTVTTYQTTARIPPAEGAGWHHEASWSNTKQMTPTSNQITVLGNTDTRARSIELNSWLTGYTIMEFLIDNVMVEGKGQINEYPLRRKKIFNDFDGDNTIVIEIVVDEDGTPTEPPEIEPEPPEVDPDPTPRKAVNIQVEIINLYGAVLDDYSVESFTVTALSTSGWANHQELTPNFNEMTVEANDQRRLDSVEDKVSITFTLSEVVIRDQPDLQLLLPSPLTKVFSTLDNDNTVTFRVAVQDQ